MDEFMYHYWGKARPNAPGPSCHLLPYHCLDVAAVGGAYLRANPGLSAFFADRLQCTEEQWLSWAMFWLALHDLGKFSEAFQSQRADLFEQWHHREPSRPYHVRHDTLGQEVWKRWLEQECLKDRWFGPGTEALEHGLSFWARAVTGHHGQPPEERGRVVIEDHFTAHDKKAIRQFTGEMMQLFLGDSAEAIFQLDKASFERAGKDLSWWFAGVAVLSDWLGSNTEYFPYCDQPMPLAEYWLLAQQRAEQALMDSGVLPVPVQAGKSLADLFPKIQHPSPLQVWAAQVELAAEPQLYILEDVTGAGKTEAAVLLAYRLLSAKLADGFFIGLPTMATANAMYGRIADVYRALFSGVPSLTLAHGSKDLVEPFSATVLRSTRPEHDSRQEDETASARCAAWLADHNKRSLLAPAGVGTIDQAMQAVLHSRHQSIRLLGLYRKVLIVDEVHACDAYMGQVLCRVLEFHARAGGSVILLSATLPTHIKESLLKAYASGRGASVSEGALANERYPLVTRWHAGQADALAMFPLASRPDVCRRVSIDYRSDLDAVQATIRADLAAGRCVCWVRNTVADAIDAFRLLEEADPILFHARFTLQDRLDREAEILRLFGRESTADDRRGRLVIATQVIEQSLDVDFDVLVSDLAPMDRLLQRAGRMHRHVRDRQGDRLQGVGVKDQRDMPCLIVYGPPFTNEPKADWYKAVLPGASVVYPHHGQAWRTARELQRDGYDMPGDARALIESVFQPGDDDLPEKLRGNAAKSDGQGLADKSIAQNNTLKFSGGYTRGDMLDWWSDARTPSRLGEASQSIVLARWVGDRLEPWAGVDRDWAYSTVRMPERLIQKAVLPSDGPKLAEYERVQRQLPAEGKWSVLLGLAASGDGWEAQAVSAARQGQKSGSIGRWQYDAAHGMCVIDEVKNESEAGER
ncbi:MAG: CRISPR-associated helicase Cas3' [Pseudomonadota bacterium]